MSGAALICYFLASVCMCCIPRTDPFCHQCERSPAPKNSASEDRSPSRQSQNNNSKNNNNKPEQPLSQDQQHQPNAKSTREEEPEDVDVDEPSIMMNNKESNASDDDDKAKIKDEEFLEGDVPPTTASQVEVKEKTFPDGSREVEETTHFHDGTTSTKTKSFKK